jgi:hypothetical protein
MASILFRMLNSSRLMPAGLRQRATQPIHRARHCSWNSALWSAAIFGIFPVRGNPLGPQASAIVEPAMRLKCRSRFDISPQPIAERFQMTLTTAHISPIISVIAGLLILVMPRLLNLIVAIFLIVNGLIGLGLLKWLHM